MSERTVLFIVHNHPSQRPGGAEAYATEVFDALAATVGYRPILLAKGGPPVARTRRVHGADACFSPIEGHPDQYLLFTDGFEYDRFYGTTTDKSLYTSHLRRFLQVFQPDVVHVQHTLFLGYDLLREVRNTLPHAAIVYTLHELLPICHRDGQMVRVGSDELCDRSSPRRCHECFPEHSPQAFFRRRRFIQAQFDQVDQFLVPSEFLRGRYVEWGIPEHLLRMEDYGRLPATETAPVEARPQRERLGFFGQLSRYKGVDILLDAMRLLPAGVAARLAVHGANLQSQPAEFQTRFHELLTATSDRVTFLGGYGHDGLPGLMAGVDWVVVPSVWWENSPLVIQEAFMHGRPVICSDIGGMAEKVSDGVNGLHFRVGDAGSLARVLERAVTEPGLWDHLRAGIPPVYDMDTHVKELTGLYDDLLAARARDEGGHDGG